jgi:hypothetical protein
MCFVSKQKAASGRRASSLSPTAAAAPKAAASKRAAQFDDLLGLDNPSSSASSPLPPTVAASSSPSSPTSFSAAAPLPPVISAPASDPFAAPVSDDPWGTPVRVVCHPGLRLCINSQPTRNQNELDIPLSIQFPFFSLILLSFFLQSFDESPAAAAPPAQDADKVRSLFTTLQGLICLHIFLCREPILSPTIL